MRELPPRRETNLNFEEIANLKKENHEFQTELELAKARIEQLQSSLTRQPSLDNSTNPVLERQIHRLKDRVKHLETTKDELSDQLEHRESDLAKLRLSFKEEQNAFEDEIKELQKDYESREKRIKSELENVRSDFEHLQSSQETIVPKGTRNHQLRLEEDLDKAHENNDHLAAEVRRLKDAIRQLTDDIQETSRKLGYTEARNIDLEKKNEVLYEKQIISNERIQELEIQLQTQSNLTSKHDDDLETAFRDAESARLEKIELAERLEISEQNRAELQDSIDHVKREKDNALKRIKNLEENHEKIARSRDQLATEAQDLHDARAQLEAEVKDSQLDAKEAKRKMQIMIDQKKALEKQAEDLKVSQSKADQERLTLNSQVRESQWQKEAQQRKIIGLEFQVRRRDKEIERLQTYVQNKAHLSQTNLSDVNSGNGSQPLTDSIVKALKLEIEKLKEEVEAEKSQNRELENKNYHFQNEVKRLDTELECLMKEKSSLSDQARQHEKSAHKGEDKLVTVELELKESQRALERMKANLERSDGRLRLAEDGLIEMEQEKFKLARQLDITKQNLHDKNLEVEEAFIKVSFDKDELYFSNFKNFFFINHSFAYFRASGGRND